MNKYYLKLTSFIALFGMCVALLPVSAGNITTMTAGDAEIDDADVGADGFATTTVYWTSVDDYPAGTDILVTVTWSDTTTTGSIPQHGSSTALGACATSSAFGSAITYGTPSANQHTITLTSAVTGGTGGGVCVRVPVQDGGVTYQANFSLAVITSNASADYGAVEFYVGGGNDILVDATVQPTLEFAIVSSTDPLVNEEQHACHMGTLDLVSVGDCSYRLKVSTNALNGFVISFSADEAFNANGYATLTDIGANGTITAGTENYGIQVTTPASIGGNNGSGSYVSPINVTGDYAGADDNPVPLGSTSILSFGNSFLGTSTLSTTLVSHRAAIDAASVVGYYSHTVTYTVAPSF